MTTQQNINAKDFWNRIGFKLGNTLATDFCKQYGLKYNTFKSNRSDLRYCNVVDTYIIASSLGTTVEYLLTGKEPNSYSQELKTVIDILSKNPSKLDAVCTLLGIQKNLISNYS